jgi:chromosome segregation ATPase
MKQPLNLVFLLVFFCAFLTYSHTFADQSTSTPGDAFDKAAKELDKAKDEVRKLKDAWDKARLETTLYEQRVKRAYQKWAKAAKALKGQAEDLKKKADLEFQLAVEKRKLAFNEWQAAQFRLAAREGELKALDQEKESAAIKEKIKSLQDKIGAYSPPSKGQ